MEDFLAKHNQNLKEIQEQIKEKEKHLNIEKTAIESIKTKSIEMQKLYESESLKYDNLNKQRRELELEREKQKDDKIELVR